MRKLTNIIDLDKCIIRKGNDALAPVYDGSGNLVIDETLLDLPQFSQFKEQMLAVTEPHEYQEVQTYYIADEQEKQVLKQSHPIEMIEIEIDAQDIAEQDPFELNIIEETDFTQVRPSTQEISDIDIFIEEDKVVPINIPTHDS